MAEKSIKLSEAMAEIEELRARLEEAEESIRAIQGGEVDAVIVTGPEGEQIYTLTGAERTYRILVEAMNEGALVLSPEGVIIYCNRTFAAMLDAPIYEVFGHPIYEFVAEADVGPLKRMLEHAPMHPARREISLKNSDSGTVPAFVSIADLKTDEGPAVSAVITDLSESKRTEAELAQYREHLEELVVKRTKELAEANAELAAANAELATTNEELRIQIEQRATAEKAARESEERFRVAQELSPDGFTIFRPVRDEQEHVVDFIWVYENAAIAQMNGTDPKAVVDRRLSELFPSHRETPFQEAYVKAAETGKPQVLEAPYHGDSITNQTWFRVAVVSMGADIAVLAQDITERKQWEKEQQNLLDREHKIADMLQQALIPPQIPYEIGPYSIAARYIPALREAQVGGDFYDVFKINKNKIGVIVGDIAGKGLNAAIRVAAARYSIRSYAYIDPSPAKVLSLANEALCSEDFDVQNMLTAFFAVMDTSDGTMAYACAGHEPPVVCNARGEIRELEVTGGILGVVPGMAYSERVYKMREGDTAVIFTDGITEARRDGSILFEKAGVIKHLTKHCDAKPDDIVEALVGAATDHAEGSLQDDVAIVALGYPCVKEVEDEQDGQSKCTCR